MPPPKRWIVLVPLMPHRGPATLGRGPLARKTRALEARLRATFGDDAVRTWTSIQTPFFRRSLLECARDLRAQVDRWWADAGAEAPASVTFVAHGAAGLIVRAAVLDAASPGPRAPSPWAERVDRLVELGVPAHGVGTPMIARLFRILCRLYRTMSLGTFHPRFVADASYGSLTLTGLHLQWAEMQAAHAAAGRPPRPFVVSVLGTLDRQAGAERGAPSAFDAEDRPWARVFEVPGRAAMDVLPDDTTTDDDPRVRCLADALDTAVPTEPTATPPRGGDVVILLHGIRTSNDDWPRRLEGFLRAKDPGLRVRAPTYGYMSALSFAFPWARRRHARWFQAVYARERLADPTARFHAVAHSNGTFVLGHALARLPEMRFERVVLAGSVLPEDHWAAVPPTQVASIVNERACDDVPVGLLCAALRGLGQSSVGTAGVFGFGSVDPRIVERCYHRGGHGAALGDGNLPHVADVITGAAPRALPPPAAAAVGGGFRRLSRAMPAAAWLLLGLLVALPVLTVGHGFATGWVIATAATFGLLAGTLWIL